MMTSHVLEGIGVKAHRQTIPVNPFATSHDCPSATLEPLECLGNESNSSRDSIFTGQEDGAPTSLLPASKGPSDQFFRSGRLLTTHSGVHLETPKFCQDPVCNPGARCPSCSSGTPEVGGANASIARKESRLDVSIHPGGPAGESRPSELCVTRAKSVAGIEGAPVMAPGVKEAMGTSSSLGTPKDGIVCAASSEVVGAYVCDSPRGSIIRSSAISSFPWKPEESLGIPEVAGGASSGATRGEQSVVSAEGKGTTPSTQVVTPSPPPLRHDKQQELVFSCDVSQVRHGGSVEQDDVSQTSLLEKSNGNVASQGVPASVSNAQMLLRPGITLPRWVQQVTRKDVKYELPEWPEAVSSTTNDGQSYSHPHGDPRMALLGLGSCSCSSLREPANGVDHLGPETLGATTDRVDSKLIMGGPELPLGPRTHNVYPGCTQEQSANGVGASFPPISATTHATLPTTLLRPHRSLPGWVQRVKESGLECARQRYDSSLSDKVSSAYSVSTEVNDPYYRGGVSPEHVQGQGPGGSKAKESSDAVTSALEVNRSQCGNANADPNHKPLGFSLNIPHFQGFQGSNANVDLGFSPDSSQVQGLLCGNATLGPDSTPVRFSPDLPQVQGSLRSNADSDCNHKSLGFRPHLPQVQGSSCGRPTIEEAMAGSLKHNPGTTFYQICTDEELCDVNNESDADPCWDQPWDVLSPLNFPSSLDQGQLDGLPCERQTAFSSTALPTLGILQRLTEMPLIGASRRCLLREQSPKVTWLVPMEVPGLRLDGYDSVATVKMLRTGPLHPSPSIKEALGPATVVFASSSCPPISRANLQEIDLLSARHHGQTAQGLEWAARKIPLAPSRPRRSNVFHARAPLSTSCISQDEEQGHVTCIVLRWGESPCPEITVAYSLDPGAFESFRQVLLKGEVGQGGSPVPNTEVAGVARKRLHVLSQVPSAQVRLGLFATQEGPVKAVEGSSRDRSSIGFSPQHDPCLAQHHQSRQTNLLSFSLVLALCN